MHFAEELSLAYRLLKQQKYDQNKLNSLHTPEVECIAKGKAHKRYEFGVKVSIATTNKNNFAVGGMALSRGPYDGHTLKIVLRRVHHLSGQPVDEVFVDRGYRGHEERWIARSQLSERYTGQPKECSIVLYRTHFKFCIKHLRFYISKYWGNLGSGNNVERAQVV